jgi:uncharacterized protein YjaZ
LVNSKRRKKIKDNSGGQGFSNTGTQLFAEKNLIHSLNESSATQLKDTASGKTRARNRFQSSAISKTFDKEKMTPTIRESKPRLGRKAKRGISMSKKSRRFRKALNRCMMKKYKIMCSEIGCGFKFASQLSLIAHRFHHHRRIYFVSLFVYQLIIFYFSVLQT